MLLLDMTPTHTLATWLLKTIDGMLNHLGLGHDKTTKEIVYIVIISILSVLIGICIKKIVLYITRKAMAIKKTEIAQELLDQHVFEKCSHIIPPLVFMAMIPFAFTSESRILIWIYKIVGIYSLIAFAMGVNAVLKFAFDRFNERENRKNLPLKGVLDIARGTVWIIIFILAVSILLEKSPGTLLAGLGAFAAALMLIFKNSILGFVAGIQMSDNDMLRVGDWIVVPGTPANGYVQDVSLSTVKVLNWDLTTVMVPPYTLVSSSFQNYRSMYDYNNRRIENSLIIDMSSIQPITDEMVDSVCSKFPEMTAFVSNLRKQGMKIVSNDNPNDVQGSIETNLGLFRAYVGTFLENNPKIAKNQTILVRLMQATEAGIPLQIYCFTATSNWGEFEAVQSAVMEHLASVVNQFGGLSLYSGNNIRVDGDTYSDKVANPTSTH